MSTLVDAHRQVHVKARDRRAVEHIGGSVGQIGKLHEILQLVVGGKRRVFQVVLQVGSTEHVHASPHLQVVNESIHRTIEVDKCLAKGLRPGSLLGVDKFKIVGTHADIERHAAEVGEVERSLHIERAVVVGKHLEVLKLDVTVLNGHGVVGEAQAHAVRLAVHMAGIEIELAVDIGCRRCTLELDGTLGIAVETDDLVGDEAVEIRHRHAVEGHRRVDDALAGRVIRTCQRAHLVAVARDDAVDIVTAVTLRHISELRADVAHRTATIHEVVYVDRRRD